MVRPCVLGPHSVLLAWVRLREPTLNHRNTPKSDAASGLTVLITARWWIFRGTSTSNTQVDCVTTGAWERDAELAIKERAEHSKGL